MATAAPPAPPATPPSESKLRGVQPLRAGEGHSFFWRKLHSLTGIIALLYIAYHVWTQRFSGVSLPEHPGAAFHKVQAELANPVVLVVYIIAMIATTWHFAYGIWLFAAKWGITPGDKARKKFGWVCGLGGAALCLMGLISIYAVVTAPPAPEDVMPEQPGITLLKPSTPPPNSTNSSQPGQVQ